MKLPDYVKDYTHLFNWTDFWGEPIPEKYKYAAVDGFPTENNWNGLLYVYSVLPTYEPPSLLFCSEPDCMYIGVVQYSGSNRDTLKVRANYPSEIYEIEKCIDIIEKQGYIVSLPRVSLPRNAN